MNYLKQKLLVLNFLLKIFKIRKNSTVIFKINSIEGNIVKVSSRTRQANGVYSEELNHIMYVNDSLNISVISRLELNE
jgi:hypothetical protein